MSQLLSQVYHDVYSREVSQGATFQEAHKTAQVAVREASTSYASPDNIGQPFNA